MWCSLGLNFYGCKNEHTGAYRGLKALTRAQNGFLEINSASNSFREKISPANFLALKKADEPRLVHSKKKLVLHAPKSKNLCTKKIWASRPDRGSKQENHLCPKISKKILYSAKISHIYQKSSLKIVVYNFSAKMSHI